jgi:hypothetical protein
LYATGNAQKNDYIWLTGYDSSNTFDTTCQCWFGITKFDFNQSPMLITHDSLGINFYRSNSIVSDSNGNLVLYSNGVQVRNTHDVILNNGDSLGWGPLFSYWNPTIYYTGMVYSQSLITLPNPRKQNIYDLFYVYIDTLSSVRLSFTKLLHSRIDMSASGGRGSVITKDEVILQKDIDITISAVKHGNGRDWWLCTNQTQSNCHDLLLYTGDDSMKITKQCIGVTSPLGDAHSCRFSQDGNVYVTTNDSGQVDIFNFDRCNGTLTLHEQFTIAEIADSFQWMPTGIEFSPNSRFLYVFCSYRIFQYDLTASPIAASKTTIAKYHFLGHDPADYFWGQLAPDGKIYVASGGTTYYQSVIDSPDNKGSACGFLDQSMRLPTFSAGLPYNPNYRLGALPGSPCDTLTGLNEDVRADKEKIIKVFPNPATDMITFDYGFTDWSKGEIILEISNQLGQVVYTQKLPMYSGFQKIDVSNYASGMYTAFIKRNDSIVATVKFVKE